MEYSTNVTSMGSEQFFEEEPVNNYHQTKQVLSPAIHDDPRFNLFVEGLREKSNFDYNFAYKKYFTSFFQLHKS